MSRYSLGDPRRLHILKINPQDLMMHRKFFHQAVVLSFLIREIFQAK